MKREFLEHERVLFRHICLALNIAIEIEINERVELRFKRFHIVPQLPEPSSRSVLLLMLKALNSFEHIIRPRFGKRHVLKPFLHLESERFFLEIPLRARAELFRAPIVPIPLAELAGRPLRRNHAAALTAPKKSGERKIVRLPRMPGLRSLDKFFLHGFKQCRRKNWRKASGKIFVAMLGKSEKRAIGEDSFHGSFAKWRSGLRRHAVESQKLRHRNERVAALRVLLERADDNLGLHRVRLDVARARVVDVAEGRFGEPLAAAQFLAHAPLHVLLQVVAVILRLAERHLQHKEPLRCRLKPKCRKAQRDDFRGVHGVYDAPAVNGVASETVGMPRQNAEGTVSLDAGHHRAEHLASGALCAFRLLKFRKDFKIFSRRKLAELDELRFDRHDLLVIVLGTLASVEKIFWFSRHINRFWIQKVITIEVSFLFTPALRFCPHPHGGFALCPHTRACGARRLCPPN